MGIDITLFAKLTELSGRFRPEGRSLMLGRQGFRIKPHNKLRANRLLRMAGYEDLRVSDLEQDDGFSEMMWQRLGFPGMESMDVSDFENATILHDLNQPVPETLHGQFDFIFDGGTIEHVFNVPVALASLFQMLRPGGRIISANGMNGWVGHGFYQFNPEFVWSWWKRSCGCRVHQCVALPKDDGSPEIDLPDIADYGTRIRLGNGFPQGRIYLYYEVERAPESALGIPSLQSDYVRKFDEHAQVAALETTGRDGAPRRIIRLAERQSKRARRTN